jgi:hypothetical protein
MKNKKHIQSFNEHQENLNISNVSGSTWDDLWQEFIEDCEKSNKTIIEASDFFFWLDFGFKVPERL